jgi:hypothetical protein
MTENPYGKKNCFLKMQLKNRLAWYLSILIQCIQNSILDSTTRADF